MTALVVKRKSLSFLIASIYIPHDKDDAIEIYKEIAALLQKYKLDIPTVLMGDFNGKPDPIKDHFLQPGSITTHQTTQGDRKIRKLLDQRGHRPMQDSYRVMNKDKVEYSNFSSGAKSRIDLAILNDLAMKTCKESSILQDTIDPGLTHRPIKLLLEFSNSILQSKPQQNMAKDPKINWKIVTAEMIETLRNDIESDPEICVAHEIIKREDPTSMTGENLQKLVNNTYTAVSRSILRNTKQVLPIIKTGQIPKNSTAKLERLRADRRELVETTKLNKSNSIIDKLLAANRLQALFDKFSPAELEHTPNMTKYVSKKINQYIHRQKRKQIAESITKRQIEFALNQKKHIDSIMNRRKDFDGIVCAKDPITEEITTDQKEVESRAVEYFEAKMTQTANPIPNPQGIYINMHEVNSPLEDITDDLWVPLMKCIKDNKIITALNKLPKGKASGLDAIPNEILQLVITPNSKLLDIISASMNITVAHQVYPTKITEGIMIMIPKIDNWNGELDKLRPITLLNTLHKLFERVMNDRLCDILHKYKILKGPNFGFQAGQGTGDPLFAISNLLAFCKAQNIDFYTSTLDIAACFDKLPWDAIENGLNRIKIPANFIKMLQIRRCNLSVNYSSAPHLVKQRDTGLQLAFRKVEFSVQYFGLLHTTPFSTPFRLKRPELKSQNTQGYKTTLGYAA